MIFIVDKNDKIINTLKSDDLCIPNSKPYYPWLWLGDTWSDEKPLDYAKQEKRRQVGRKFAAERDKIRYVQINNMKYGFDCKGEDITNFMANMKLAEIQGYSVHKVYTELGKDLVVFTYDQFQQVLNEVSTDQIKAYKWYSKVVKEIEEAQTIDELEKVVI